MDRVTPQQQAYPGLPQSHGPEGRGLGKQIGLLRWSVLMGVYELNLSGDHSCPNSHLASPVLYQVELCLFD